MLIRFGDHVELPKSLYPVVWAQKPLLHQGHDQLLLMSIFLLAAAGKELVGLCHHVFVIELTLPRLSLLWPLFTQATTYSENRGRGSCPQPVNTGGEFRVHRSDNKRGTVPRRRGDVPNGWCSSVLCSSLFFIKWGLKIPWGIPFVPASFMCLCFLLVRFYTK